MPIYHKLGSVPHKRHTVFRQPNGELYPEELIGNKGFTGPSSLVYHLHRPTEVLAVRTMRPAFDISSQLETEPPLQHRHFRAHRLKANTSPTLDRTLILHNADVAMSIVAPTKEDDFFYRNAGADEVVYVGEGAGTLETQLGEIKFANGHYLIIPRGIMHRYRFDAPANNSNGANDEGTKQIARLLVIESQGYIRTPKRYRNEHGQLTENAPFSERDILRPENLQTHNEKGEFRLIVKKGNSLSEMMLANHPFDVIGWDGYYYAWAFSIHDFEPRVGRIHLPPPVHQTFEGDGFVICSFCPRPFDFDPNSLPAPYNHSNVMSDEVIYYASSEFMSRKGIEYGSITLHPDGIAHGPHPGRAEASIGAKETNEIAVMLDTFRPLHVSKQALEVEDKDYFRSWLE
ncbi:MAG: homogentisate 1,2-dioxygenase [Pyrinomonadaceae bacterium]